MSVRFKSMMGVFAVAVSLAFVPLAHAQVRDGSLESDLFASVRNKDMGGVRAALSAGANVFATDMMGNRAADVAVDLSQFDIAHYLLSVMDHRRDAQKQAARQAQKPAVVLVQPEPPVTPSPVTQPVVPPPVVAVPTMSPPQPTDPNPFAVSTPPSTTVRLSNPQLRMAGAKPRVPATPTAPLSLPEGEPKSALYIKPKGAEIASVPAPETASAPTRVPTRAPTLAPTLAPATEREEKQGWFSKMTSLFRGSEADEPTEPPQREANPAHTAPLPVAVGGEPTPAAPTESADRARLYLTAALTLGKSPPPKPESKVADMHAPAEWPCVAKGRWGIVCLEQVRWPAEISAHFDTTRGTLYRGSKVVAGYKDGRANFLYAVFRSNGFDAVVDAFTQRLGPPNLVSQRRIKPFQKRLEVNPVRTWYGFDKQAGRETVLEISMFEDQSSTFPVMDEGAIKLSYIGEDSIFRYLSPMELQRFN